MTAQAAETVADARPPAKGPNFLTRKLGPLPVWVWASIGGAAGGLYLLWRRHEDKTAATTAATAAPAATAATSSIAAALGTLQSEIGQLQGAASGAGGYSGGTGVTGTTGSAGTGTGATTATTAATGKTTASTTSKPPAPQNFHVVPAKTSAKFSWTPVPGATDYHLRINGGAAHIAPGATYTVRGLKSKTHYSATVATRIGSNYSAYSGTDFETT